MMCGGFHPACSHLAQAWQITSRKHDLLGLRILAVRFALALLMDRPYATFLGQFQTLLGQPRLTAEGIDRIWFNGPIWNWLDGRLKIHPIRGLAEAIFRAASLGVPSDALLLAKEWRASAAIPLDQTW
jgi:hypothetical protein